MKASELRLGNMVYFNGNHKHIGIVTSIQPKHIVQCCKYVEYSNDIKIGLNARFDILYDVENVKPIPLTEEILLKCGFEKTDDYGDIIYYEPKDRGNRNYYICFDHEDISFGLNVFGNCTNLLHDDSNLQFLHQLQNLIFALTGEELTVNL